MVYFFTLNMDFNSDNGPEASCEDLFGAIHPLLSFCFGTFVRLDQRTSFGALHLLPT